nr:methylmalonyl-CoA mutase [Desulfobacterales bacterium]
MEKEDYLLKLAKRYEGYPFSETLSGIPIKEYYGPEDVKGIDYAQEIGDPGKYPFTRGIYENMYRGKMWTKRVFCGLGAPQDTNKRFKYLVSHGQTGLHVFADTPTFTGLDPDHPIAKGHAGTTGISRCCLRDFKELFAGIPLTDMSISLISEGYGGSVEYGCYLAYAEQAGYDLSRLIGSCVNDPLHSVDGLIPINCSENLDLAVKLTVDVIEYSIKHTPRWHPVAFNAFDWSQKGANAYQEVAWLVGNMITYFDHALERGLKIDDVAPRANVFVLNSDYDFFESIAHFRAARKVWAKIIKERYRAKDPRSMRLYLSAHTSGASLTAQQPVNNIVRTTLQSLACVLGGLQSFDPAGYDEAYFRLTEKSGLMSLNTHNIIAMESRVAAVADPLGGSYFVEALTAKLEEKILEEVDKIESMGGMKKAISDGYIRSELGRGVVQAQKEVEEGKRVVVGVNDWIVPKESEIKIEMERDYPVEEQLRIAEQREKEIRELKKRRDNAAREKALKHLFKEAQMGLKNNLIPAVIDAYKSEATLSEIVGYIRMAYGLSYDPFDLLQPPF